VGRFCTEVRRGRCPRDDRGDGDGDGSRSDYGGEMSPRAPWHIRILT